MILAMRKYLGIAALIIVIAFAFGIRVSHPHSGLKNALGSANSGIVVYKKSHDFAVGDKILAKTTDDASSPVLAIVRSVDKEALEIQSGIATDRIEASAAFGKLIVMVPFIGTIAQVIGL
ncbi:unannotated protein [freshwater metagenome]|jgi:hypothetical protein|uniref:Unannotated protein n=1 Tax=freshwater metagenome TaxID=449393 RepID=A0A6J7RL94_9ZZZZ